MNCYDCLLMITGLGYDSQMNESEVVHSVFNSRESDVDDSPVNDRFKIGEGFHAVPPPYTGNYMPSRPNLSFDGLDDFVYKTKVSETETSISKTSKDIVEKPKTVRPSAPIIEDWDTDSDNDSVFRPKSDQTKPKLTKINFVKSGENVKYVNKENIHRQVEYPRKSQNPRDNRRNWNGLMTRKLGNGFKFINKASFVCGSFNHLIKDCDFHAKKMVEKPVLKNKGRVTGQRKIRPVWNNAQRVNHQNKLTRPHHKRNFVPITVVTKSGQVPVNTAKQISLRAAASISTAMPVNTAAPKPKVNDALPTTYSYVKAHSPVRKAFNQKSAAKKNNFNEKVNTAKVNNVTTDGPKAVVSAAMGNRENVVKSLACWIWRPTGNGNPQYTLQDQGIFDSGCSRHMIGNKSFLTDYQKINGGFVAFGGSPKGGKITRKGKIRTGKLDFEDVYFVKELKFNLFSVSQMCDKKNSVLFTKTECLVLSPDFKLLDESQVLLKVPRHNNMYSFDLKNVVPSGGLTCLFAKATIDESNLWHRRLGHINFKTMNKLVRGNLVRGLPSKLFENDHTCVACQKGKQHKASWNQTNKNTSIKDNVDAVPTQQYILLPLLYDSLQSSKDAVANDAGKKTNEEPANEEGSYAEQIFTNADDLPTNPLMPDLEDTADLLNTSIFSGAYDDEDVGAEADLNNLETHDVKQKDDGIFISQDKYVADILKKFDFVIVKTASTLIKTNKALLKDEEAKDVDVHLYRSMIGSLIYLCKQTIVANSTTEAEYVAAANCYRQVLWIQNQMLDYGLNFMNTEIYIDNESTICIVKNLVFHSKTKHIEIRHHFIRDSYEKKLIQVIKIHTYHNVADLLTKAFDVSSIRNKFRNKTGSYKVNVARQAKHIEYMSRMDGRTCNIKQKCVKSQIPKQAKRGRDTKIPQSGGPPKKVGNDVVHKELGDIMERAATTTSSLEAKQDSGNINMTQSMATLNEPGSTVPVESHHTPTGAPSTSQPPTSPPSMQTTHVAEEAATMPHDSPLLRFHSLGSDVSSMILHELTILYTTLSKKVKSLESDLKQTKLTYGAAYTKLIIKVNKLENIIKSSKTRRRVRLIVSEDKHDLEDPSKQGRKIAQLDEDEGITLPDISSANVPISTAGEKVSTASPEVKTAAESLVYIKTSAAKGKDKGKVIMKEAEPVQKKTKLQLEQERLRYEEALRLQEQLDEEERQRIARVHEEANTFNAEEWDNIQAQIKADEKLAQKLQAEERGKFSKAKKSRLLVEMINERKRLFAQQRAEQRRNKPMTQAQQRTYMCNYIKHMGSHTLQQLKRLSFDELKALFETTMRRVQTFHPIESEGDKTVPELTTGSSIWVAEVELDHEGSKKKKTNEASGSVQEQPEEEETELPQEDLQQMTMVVPVEEVYVEALHVKWNGYLRKGRKTKPKRQNRTRNGKAGKRQSQ
ncbi:ribonuclease H-like domain-containing protein, partial [Tanacetum coccineum]